MSLSTKLTKVRRKRNIAHGSNLYIFYFLKWYHVSVSSVSVSHYSKHLGQLGHEALASLLLKTLSIHTKVHREKGERNHHALCGVFSPLPHT